MSKKLVNFLSLVLILSTSASVGANDEYELFNRLKEDMWQMGLDFEYVHTSDFKVPKQESVVESDERQESLVVKSVPYDLIKRFEATF